jgi:Flp pilus assembly pilin Flp
MRLFDLRSVNFSPAMAAAFKVFSKNINGTTAIEYSLIAGMIGVAIVGALMSMGSTIGDDLLVPIANIMTNAVGSD